MRITQAETAEHMEQVRQLFREYSDFRGIDLGFQRFDEELAALPGKYAAPDGILLLAEDASGLMGCVALQPLERGIAEIKRLYVRDGFRGNGAGYALLDAVIREARRIGYQRVRLDSFARLSSALKLYKAFGFTPIPAYSHNPYEDVIYMELSLVPRRPQRATG